MLEIENAVCGYRSGRRIKKVIDGISMTVKPGEVMCILGSNGIGKTTLFRSVMGGLPLLGGSVRIDGRDLSELSIRERAGKIGYVPQSHTPPFPFTAAQVTVMGRTSHMQMFASASRRDYEIAEEALELMGIGYLKDEAYTEISGGERQLVLIARAVAQESDYLIMDEPTSNLDFGNRVRVLRRVRQLAEAGKGIIMTTHDPDHAFAVSDRVTVIKKGGQYLTGDTGEILTCALMDEIYGIRTGIADTGGRDGRRVKTVVGYL